MSDTLGKLVEKTCQHPPGSCERRRSLSRLVRAIEQSGKLWKENVPYYEEAKQQMWLYCCRNLCEATTTKEPYNPALSRVTTWLDNYLKRRLYDLRVENGQPSPDFNNIPEPSAPPQTPPILEDVEDWVK
ncbi:sigma-70 family RNA polymerase sigma factor, partial [Oscillatoriales cyanobacterium LEGE 11467]|nr:sigma-70 family RNA polymerase sigma factor [Zarconia navalis LEGE 11467]